MRKRPPTGILLIASYNATVQSYFRKIIWVEETVKSRLGSYVEEI